MTRSPSASPSKRKSRAWIKALAVSTVASPRALFSRTAAAANTTTSAVASPANEAQLQAPPATTKSLFLPVIPLRTLETLAHMVEFLEENHRRREGLYRREGLKLETSELVALCTDDQRQNQQNQLPDFALYSPHSITNTLKTILADKFEPLIPYAISQQLVDDLFGPKATGADSRANARCFHSILTEKFTHIRAITREFLKIFLLHLNHVSTSIPCRMSSKNLAATVGILLVRPTEVKKTLSAKDMLKKRLCIAEYLIEHASSLPYDCATELDVQVIPSSGPPDESEPVPSQELHFALATWDPCEHAFTLQELQDIFEAFGVVVNLGVNEANDRAIVAFQDFQSACAAAEAELPHLHVRQQKRQRPKAAAVSLEGSILCIPDAPVNSDGAVFAPMPSLALKAHQDGDTAVAEDEHLLTPLKAPTIKRVALELPVSSPLTSSLEQSESVIVAQGGESQAEPFMVVRERPLSMVFMQNMQVNQALLGSLSDSMQLEDLDSAPTSPTGLQRALENPAPSSVKSDEDDIVAVAARVERQSSSAAFASVKFANIDGDRGSNQDHEPPHTRALLPSVNTHGGDDSLFTKHHNPRSYEYNSNSSRSLQRNASNPQLRITVRSHGTVDSTATQEKLKSQTLWSPEGLKIAVATTTEGLAINESPRVKKSGFISDIKQILWRKKTSPSSELTTGAAAVVMNRSASGNQKQHEDETHAVALSPTRSLSLPTLAITLNEFDTKIPVHNERSLVRAKPSGESREPAVVCQDTETQTVAQPLRPECTDKATETMIQPPERRGENESSALLSTLEGKLKNMQMILETTSGALSSTKKPTEFDRALFQLHAQLLEMVSESLTALTSDGKPRCGGGDESTTNVTTNAAAAAGVSDEFLHFLEIQSRTQVKILEVEVRAGQELIRLHKSQFEKERSEMEQEMTALRMARSEVERMCAELRADLRKCRTELSCYVAHTTNIKREKSEIQERLTLVETQRQAKEFALAKLQSDYEEMRHVAAQAQMRVEKFAASNDSNQHTDRSRGLFWGNKESSYLNGGINETSNATANNYQLPETTRFFQEHHRPQVVQQSEAAEHNETAKQHDQNQQQSSNVAALEAMKRKMAADIQRQIELTKSALREMEISDDNNTSIVEEEEEELRRLQQQLAVSTAEIDDAMQESRRKLDSLLGSSESTSRHWPRVGDEACGGDHDEMHISPSELVHDVRSRTRAPATDSGALHLDNKSSARYDLPQHSSPHVQWLHQHHHSNSSELLPPRREAQSALYRKWQEDRALKIAHLASARDQQTLRQAQHSMQLFQQTLAAVQSSGQR